MDHGTGRARTGGARSGGAARRAARAASAAAALLLLAAAAPAWAQDAFIQLEAERSRAEAEAAARSHAERLDGVRGFATAGGWYVVALGPFPVEEARARLARLRAERRVPLDTFLTEGDLYREPLGGGGAAAAAPLDETPEAARAGEAALGRDAREEVQRALAWAGAYDGAIDGAFGAGTRRAMAAWQAARGLAPTGTLTGAQRAALLGEYLAALDDLDLARVEDGPAGIAVEMPTAALAFEGRETPFSRYGATDGSVARLILISQEGDGRTLAGLFEILRSLEVVPRGGGHRLEEDRFRLRARDEARSVRGFARLRDGRIKGMLLVWPAEDEARLGRLWRRMRASFEALPDATLGPEHAGPAAAARPEWVGGLAARRPTLARTGFFVDGEGAVLTTAEVTAGSCGRVLIDDAHEAEVAWTDGRVALLRPVAPLAPPRVARLAEAPVRPGETVAVAGFPFGGALERASLAHGRLEARRGLGGDADLDRYALPAEPGDAGGPVLAPDGAVAGLLLSGQGGEAEGRTLPEGVAFGVDAGRLRAILEEVGVAPAPGSASGDASADASGPVTPERLEREGAEMAVLVTCHA